MHGLCLVSSNNTGIWCMVAWCAQNGHWYDSSFTCQQPYVTTQKRCKYTTLVDIKKAICKLSYARAIAVPHSELRAGKVYKYINLWCGYSAMSLLSSREQRYIKMINRSILCRVENEPLRASAEIRGDGNNKNQLIMIITKNTKRCAKWISREFGWMFI